MASTFRIADESARGVVDAIAAACAEISVDGLARYCEHERRAVQMIPGAQLAVYMTVRGRATRAPRWRRVRACKVVLATENTIACISTHGHARTRTSRSRLRLAGLA